MSSLDQVRTFLAHREIIFFEVWPSDEEDLNAVAADLQQLRCYVSVDHVRRIIRIFAPNKRPARIG